MEMSRAENPLKSKAGLERAMDIMCATAIGFISAGKDKRAMEFLEAAGIAQERMAYLERRTKFASNKRAAARAAMEYWRECIGQMQQTS